MFLFLPELSFSTMYGQPSKVSHVLIKITLRYKLKGRTFDSRWYHWNFLLM